MEKTPMTAEGYKTLQSELKNLKDKERHDVIKAIAAAREHGDLSENAEYHAAREKQSFIEGRIMELEAIISSAEVIDPKRFSDTKIRFGATVVVADEDTDEEKTFFIVGKHEADIKSGKISIASPFSRSLIGKTIGDSVEVVAPGGSKAYEILKVAYQ